MDCEVGMKHLKFLRKFALLALLLPEIAAAATDVHPATITAITPSGVGYVNFSRDANGVNANLGRWDTPYSGGANGPPEPGLEPAGNSTLSIDVDVGDGGLATFDYTLKTWDGGIWDWYDISVITPAEATSLVSHLGKPGNDYGTYFDSPHIPISVSLNQWRNQHVTFIFSVRQDGWGDQTQGQVIDFNLSTCSVAPLAPLTDPAAIRFENGDTVDIEHLQENMRTALDCLNAAATNEHGTITITSAYRPPSYQEHLREVWDKWRLLRAKREAECQELKEEIHSEFVRHGLLASQRPAAANGPHTTGAAADITSSLPPDRLQPLAEECELRRPLPITDPVHYIHQ
jgi:hypothetical protein